MIAWQIYAKAIAIIAALAAGLWLGHIVRDRYELQNQLILARAEVSEARGALALYMGQVQRLDAKYKSADQAARKAKKALRKHDLARIAAAKPGLVAKRATDATARVLDDLETLTQSFASTSEASSVGAAASPDVDGDAR